MKQRERNKENLPEYCIWDFNGTILDDVETGICSVNDLLRKRGLKTIESKEEYQSIFCFPIQKYYESLGFDFAEEPYEVIAPLWVEQYLIHAQRAKMFDDVKETLEYLHNLGIKQTVLSATESHMLQKQLSDLGIKEYFEEILGLDNIHAESKLALAKKWRKKHPMATAIFLGDTDHDCETAKMMGAECLLIARGHQSFIRLKEQGVPIFLTLSDWRKHYF